jgi:hypothetical protein
VITGSEPALTAALRPPQAGDRLESDAREVFGTLSNNIRYDPGQRLWTLRIPDEDRDPDGLLSQFAWTFGKDGAALRAAWNPDALAPAK